ncbi:MAG: acetyltransferase [Acidobacteriota bacterium]
MKRIFVFGAGGHGKVVADILLTARLTGVAGFVDDNERLKGTKVIGLPVFGNSEWLQAEASTGKVAVALGIGENRLRQKIAERCLSWGIELITAVHPSAVLSRSSRVGIGTTIMAGAVLNPDSLVGCGVIVNTGAVVEHDTLVGDYAHISPNATMGGGARLGWQAHLGLGAIVLPGISVGDAAIVGAGAVVVEDLPDNVIAMGVPARVHRKVEEQKYETNTAFRSAYER